MSNLWLRAVFGVLFVGAILTALFWHFFIFVILFLGFVILSADEFNKLLQEKTTAWLNVISNGLLFLIAAAFAYDYCSAYGFLLMLLFPVLLVFIGIYKNLDILNHLKNWSLTTLYIGIGYISLIALSFPPFSDFHYSNEIIIALFATVWLFDTFAYLTGRLTGKHKMFPIVSPGKSWEGFAGGWVLTLAAITAISGQLYLLSDLQWVLFVIIAIGASFAGDYTESLLKRRRNVKDSGIFLPGHGGVLDRFDSILFAAPAVVIYIYLLSL